MVGEGRAFVSHAHEDGVFAARLVEAIESAGLPCWIAPRDIVAGRSWDEAIVDGLDRSSVFVLVFSRFAAASVQVAKELGLADAVEVGHSTGAC